MDGWPSWRTPTVERLSSKPTLQWWSARCFVLLVHALLAEFPGERAAVHSESAGSLRDVKTCLGKHLVNPLPLQGLDRGLSFGEAYVGIPLGPAERRFDVVRIGRLREIVARPKLDRFDGRRDAGIARENDDQHLRIMRVQGLHACKSGSSAGQFEIDDRVIG